jgi:hypothetical protein
VRADVVVGPGNLAGRGLYAARDFAAGEVIVTFGLSPLTRAGYLALPVGEDLFVHSFGGERYLFAEPARFINHADEPNAYQDFERECDVAARAISKGEPITIDASLETHRELVTFLDQYVVALSDPAFAHAARLIDDHATVWLNNGPHHGLAAIECAFEKLRHLGPITFSGATWMVARRRWQAVCSYEYRWLASPSDVAGSLTGHATAVLAVIDGNWQLIYEHRSDA